jgi:hypothetical protein
VVGKMGGGRLLLPVSEAIPSLEGNQNVEGQ